MKFNETADTLYQFTWGEFCDWYLEFSKLPMMSENEAEKNETITTLLYVLDSIVRLLHPIMPFITEEIWQKLPVTKDKESIMISSFPKKMDIKINPEIENNIRVLKGVITSLRTIRSQNQIPPSVKLPIHIWGQIKNIQTFEAQIKKLCNVESISYKPIQNKNNSAYNKNHRF